MVTSALAMVHQRSDLPAILLEDASRPMGLPPGLRAEVERTRARALVSRQTEEMIRREATLIVEIPQDLLLPYAALAAEAAAAAVEAGAAAGALVMTTIPTRLTTVKVITKITSREEVPPGQRRIAAMTATSGARSLDMHVGSGATLAHLLEQVRVLT